MKRVLEEAIEAGEEPTRAKVNQAIKKVRRPRGVASKPQKRPNTIETCACFSAWSDHRSTRFPHALINQDDSQHNK